MKKITLSSVLVVLALGASSLQAEVYSFELNPPNTAKDVNENVIRLTGAGKFDTSSRIAQAHGSFKKFDAAGQVISKGRWTAIDFWSFDTNGGPSPGFQTGRLVIEVALSTEGGPPEIGQMTVCCDLSALGFEGPCGMHVEGTTFEDFNIMTGGLTLFNLHGRQ